MGEVDSSFYNEETEEGEQPLDEEGEEHPPKEGEQPPQDKGQPLREDAQKGENAEGSGESEQPVLPPPPPPAAGSGDLAAHGGQQSRRQRSASDQRGPAQRVNIEVRFQFSGAGLGYCGIKCLHVDRLYCLCE